ncbi:Protein HEAT INTOLERANT 4 [Bienertia sinuspersici]
MAKRKLAQRKAAPKKNEQVDEENKDEVKHVDEGKEVVKSKVEDQKKQKEQEKETKKVGNRPRKVTKPNSEPEYFEDKRNLEDLWREVFPVGTEWDQMHLVYQFDWNFTNLENAFDEGGVLHGKRVYLFGCTEPQMVPFKNEMKIIQIPVVVAVVSPFPPSDKIGINSVQREAEEIVPMKRMKMDWVPYVPLENRYFILSLCELLCVIPVLAVQCVLIADSMYYVNLQGHYGRKVEIRDIYPEMHPEKVMSALRHLKEDRVKTYEYCLPYFYQPLKEDELEQSTEVQILYEMDEKPVFCEFDWDLDELEEFTDSLISEEQLPADHKESFKNFVREKVREAKKANREAREARKKALEEMNQETKAAFENMRFYKFYPVPTPNTPDLSGVKVGN